MTSLGEKIKEARKKKKITQKDLANELGVTSGAVSHWEQGKAQPTKNNIERIEEILDLPLRIGEWVDRKRIEMGMSVNELADKSGVSVPAIYNIEKGKIQNPQETTIGKLEAILKDKVPEEVKATSAEVSRIEGLGSIRDFSPHEKEEWPDVPGVYLLYDISDRLIYVGQSKNIKSRFKQHFEKFWFKSPIVEQASYIEIGNDTFRKQVEAVLIKSLKSHAVLNDQGVGR